MNRTYLTEFPDFDAPADCAALLAKGWKDESWHNDTCPNFTLNGKAALFVDYLNPDLRECGDDGAPRFTVYAIGQDGSYSDNARHFAALGDAIAYVESIDPHKICAKWVKRLGLGFHPDTRGADYAPAMQVEEIADYEADIAALFSVAADPYECGLIAMRDAGLIPD